MKVLPMKKIMFNDKYGLTRAVLDGKRRRQEEWQGRVILL